MLEPSLPKADEFGRLTTTSPLRPGWPCRWCLHPLGYTLNHQTCTATGVVGCCNCDQGATSRRR